MKTIFRLQAMAPAVIMTLLISLNSLSAFAADQVGTLTQLEGKVQVFTNPSKKLHNEAGAGARALYEGEYYIVKDAALGDRVEQGNILRTAIGAKVRVVFDNGDQFNVGSGTAYRIFWNKDAADAKTQMNLMYGKLRGVVAKGGPRSRLQIRTKAATMGVRGTDFFIAEDGATGETEISILRGTVEVKQADAPKQAPPVAISTGQSASIVAPPPPPPAPKATEAAKPETKVADGKPADAQKPVIPEIKPAPVVAKIEIRKTTQEELVGIQKTSEIKKPDPAKVDAATPAPVVSKEITEKLAKLETKAVETTITDVKTYTPNLVAKLDTSQIKDVSQIHALTVQELVKEAPKAPPTRKKPYMSELENIESGAYEKYFKIIE